jgi:PBP1b-binding outer membrane lipoprotein LpoB
MNLSKLRSFATTLALAGLISGCVYEKTTVPAGIPAQQIGVNDPGFVAGTGIESQDLVAVTDKMGRSILNIPQITNAVGTPCIVLDPIKNNTRFPISKDIFLTRIQDELIRQAAGRVTFLARDRMEALQREKQLKQSGQVTASSDPGVVEFKGADYFLTGTLDSISTRSDAGASDYVLYSFQLIDARTSAIVWADSAEIKKQGQSDAAYR